MEEIIYNPACLIRVIRYNRNTMTWKEKAIQALHESLHPIPTEHNNLDWKSDLSPDKERLAQHLSAFANNDGGGFLVFGVTNDGQFISISKEKAEEIVNKLSNIATNRLQPSFQIEHSFIEYEGHPLLFIHIPEQRNKPVYMRGANPFDTYWRSGGSTRRMPEDMVRRMMAQTEGYAFEQQIAKHDISAEEVMRLLSYETIFALKHKIVPENTDSILRYLKNCSICTPGGHADTWNITNMGALLFAHDLRDFPTLRHRYVIIRRYNGTNNRNLLIEHIETRGYAVSFEDIIEFTIRNTSAETIDVLREATPTYPRVAIREFIANAIAHQDFMINGISLTIEIFTDRLVITNPGTPLNDIRCLIHMPPVSRNNDLAQTMYELGMCERRGSGLDRAVAALEEMFLPAVRIEKSDLSTTIKLFPKKPIKEMSKQEKIDICYQHACLMYEDNKSINNQSVRNRFKLENNQAAMATRIINDTLHAELIKPVEPDMAKKFMAYYPYYA